MALNSGISLPCISYLGAVPFKGFKGLSLGGTKASGRKDETSFLRRFSRAFAKTIFVHRCDVLLYCIFYDVAFHTIRDGGRGEALIQRGSGIPQKFPPSPHHTGGASWPPLPGWQAAWASAPREPSQDTARYLEDPGLHLQP